LTPKTKDSPEEQTEEIQKMLLQQTRYITLNQVNVRIAGGGQDKLLVVRDVTSIVMNEKIVQTRKDMGKVTD
jgi:hypothetical protein